MAKKRRDKNQGRISSNVDKGFARGEIKSLSDRLLEQAGIHFSLRFLDCTNSDFSFDKREPDYYSKLIRRLKDVSQLKAQELFSNRSSGLRAHPIDFINDNVSEKTFGVKGWKEIDDLAYQFEVAQSLGRVHGFLVDTTFYVRWIDPDHNLYKGKHK